MVVEINPPTEAENLQSEINTLKIKLGEKDEEINKLSAENKEFRNLEVGVKKIFQPDQIDRMKNPTVSNNKKWSSMTLQLCLQLFLMLGTAAYNFLRKERNFPAPCISTLRYYMSMISMEPGVISNDLMNLLAKKVSKMRPASRICALVIDEMSIQAQIDYDNTTQAFIGHPTMSHSEKQRAKKLAKDENWTPMNDVATKALNFELAGLEARWKQLILFHFTSNSLDSKEFAQVVANVIRQCYSIGLKVMVTTMDSASSNQAL